MKNYRTIFNCSILFKSKINRSMTFGSRFINLNAQIMSNRVNGMAVVRYTDIAKSQEDSRLYRGIQFTNQLKVVLVSDSTTEKSAAALDVNVGSMCDPKELPGLAHFLEHMLFLGTEKFPLENEYSKYLSEHGGSMNACTSSDHTQFFFDILPDHLHGALERFAQFFLCPLFTESATSREVNAVNSEHEKNLASDSWRLNQLEKSMSKIGHAYSKFGTGNIETLQQIPLAEGIDVRTELLNFHHIWYSSNIMTLVVLGRESLDELEDLVTPLFLDVLNLHVKPPIWLDHPVGPDQMRLQVLAVPIQDMRSLNISFPIPDMHEEFRTEPCHYVSHLVGHEGAGSLLSALKRRGWCSNLISGERSAARGFSSFNVNVDLTTEGLDHVNDIITLIFQYLNLIRKEGAEKWVFEECRQLKEIAFRFKDKETPFRYVSRIASFMHLYPMEEVLVGPYKMTDWKPELITQLLDLLIPSRVRIAVVSQSFDKVANLEEAWYGTKYKLDTISQDVIEKYENCGLCPELVSPKPNIFIPTNFDLLPKPDKVCVHPTVVHNSSTSRLWYKQDDTFLLPKASAQFQLSSPFAYLDPLNASLTTMFARLLRDQLNEFAYDASLAGLSWGLESTKQGVWLTVKGYNDKLKVLFDKVLDKMTDFTIDEARFDIIKEEFVRGLKNFDAEPPYQQTSAYMSYLMSEVSWSKSDLVSVVDRVTVVALRQLLPVLLTRLHVEALVHGNISKAAAIQLVQSLEQKLSRFGQLLPLQPSQLLNHREIELKNGSHFVYVTNNKFHKSCCTDAYFQCGLQNTQSNVELELIAQILSEPCFDILRTKEQLGYIVVSNLRRASGAQGLRFIIQSDKHPNFVLLRIEAFLEHARTLLQTLSQKEFQRHRDALAALKLEKPKRIHQQALRYWMEITSQQYHFDRAEVEVAYLHSITIEHLQNFFAKHLSPDSDARHRVTVQIMSEVEGSSENLNGNDEWWTAVPEGCKKPLKQPVLIDDVTSFKGSHGLYPLVQPYIELPGPTKSKL